jgi:hypothetical protein
MLGDLVLAVESGSERMPIVLQPTRTMLGHAMRHELEELAALVTAEGDETLTGAITVTMERLYCGDAGVVGESWRIGRSLGGTLSSESCYQG